MTCTSCDSLYSSTYPLRGLLRFVSVFLVVIKSATSLHFIFCSDGCSQFNMLHSEKTPSKRKDSDHIRQFFAKQQYTLNCSPQVVDIGGSRLCPRCDGVRGSPSALLPVRVRRTGWGQGGEASGKYEEARRRPRRGWAREHCESSRLCTMARLLAPGHL